MVMCMHCLKYYEQNPEEDDSRIALRNIRTCISAAERQDWNWIYSNFSSYGLEALIFLPTISHILESLKTIEKGLKYEMHWRARTIAHRLGASKEQVWNALTAWDGDIEKLGHYDVEW